VTSSRLPELAESADWTAGRRRPRQCTVRRVRPCSVYRGASGRTRRGQLFVRSRRVRAGVAVAMSVIALTSCGSSTPVHTATAVSPTPVGAHPSAASGPCASVTTTTDIGQVPAACAALWAPYGVTKVPPVNLTDSTPVTPVVTNLTDGIVSDSQLASWTLASNRDSVWYRWAEANVQPALLSRLGVVRLDPAAELEALASGESVAQPDCDLFPQRVRVFPITPADHQFFIGEGETLSSASAYAFVGTYAGGCVVTAKTASGQTIDLASFPSAGVTFFAGHVVNDPVLGAILYYDGAGNCDDRGAPTLWCRA
jgi:hypothetical protein